MVGNKEATEKQMRRVMRRFGLMAVFPDKNPPKMCKRHKKYPYLLKNKIIRQIGELKAGVTSYFQYYNLLRLPQGFDYEVLDNMYQSFRSEKQKRNIAA